MEENQGREPAKKETVTVERGSAQAVPSSFPASLPALVITADHLRHAGRALAEMGGGARHFLQWLLLAFTGVRASLNHESFPVFVIVAIVVLVSRRRP